MNIEVRTVKKLNFESKDKETQVILHEFYCEELGKTFYLPMVPTSKDSASCIMIMILNAKRENYDKLILFIYDKGGVVMNGFFACDTKQKEQSNEG